MAEYIDREAILSEIERREALMVGDKRISVDAMKHFIKNRPAADVAPVRHGRWIAIKVPNEWDKGQCSECRSIFNSSVWGTNYCPNCGADMRGSNDE